MLSIVPIPGARELRVALFRTKTKSLLSLGVKSLVPFAGYVPIREPKQFIITYGTNIP